MENNKMAVMPVNRLLLSMGIPMVLSMVLQAVYNIVDSAFVANMSVGGEQALNALTLAFPVQMLMVAIGIGTGVGANALVARSLGQGDSEKASRSAGNALFLAAVIYAVFVLFGLFGVDAYIGSQAENALIREPAADYLRICCVFSLGIAFFSVYEKLLQAGGHSVFSTIAQIGGAVTNIILDPILIYGLLGLPEMGVKGAAIATVIGQLVSFLLALIFHLKVNKVISNNPKYLVPSAKIIAQIYSIGLPAIIAQALMSLMTYALNLILGGLGEEAVTAYGLYYKIQQFILFAAFGIRDAMTPVISFNYGMGSRARVRGGVKYGLLFTLIIMTVGTLAAELFAVPLSDVFGLSERTEALCVSAMRIISAGFVFAGANIALQGVFQALDGGTESLIISFCRQLVLILPPVALLVGVAKQNAGFEPLVWTAFPLCELITAVIALLLYLRIRKKKILALKA